MKRAHAGEGALLVIQGLAGAGKTALIRATVRRAMARGTLVLEAVGSELERELGYGVVRALFETLLLERGAEGRRLLLAGAASKATPVVWTGQADTPAEPAAVLHGLYWLVSNLADGGPVMLVVDDAHWADRPSLRFLAYLARRLNGLPVLLVVAMRPGESAGRAELLSTITRDPAAAVITPSPLSETAVGRLVAERLTGVPSPAFIAACHAATGGSPYLVGELLTELASDGVMATVENAPRVGRIAPKSVSSAVLVRISRIGREAPALTEGLAVLGSAELREAAALAGLDQDVAARAADALAAAGVIGSSRPLVFAHPLVRTAVYEAVPPGRRALTHRAAARFFAREGASPDRVALHLLNAEPAGEAWAVQALREAAAGASAKGAPEEAAGYLLRALREPPAPGRRAAVLHELGAAELLAREPGATEHLAEGLAAAGDLQSRANIALLLGRASVSAGRLADARRLLAPVVEQLSGAQPGMVARLEAYRAAAGIWDPRFTTEVERDIPRLRELAERSGPDGRPLLLMLAFRSTSEGRPTAEVLDLVERGLDGGRLIESESAEAIEVTWAARALTFTDELDAGDRLVEEMFADSRRRGSVMGYATASAWRAAIALRRGLVDQAEADARTAVELIVQHGLHFIAPHAYSFLGEALVEQGRLDDAGALLEHPDLGPMQGSVPEARLLHTRARLHLARGNNPAAIADLRAGEGRQPWFRNPNAMAWRSTLAMALPSSSHAEAARLVDLELERAREIGQPRAIGVALRARGLLSVGEQQLSTLTESLAVLEGTPSRLERAHTLTALGAALRRTGRRSEAREVLVRGLDLAAACGARALADRARTELVIAGARPRRARLTGIESLTASEWRVAQMAAEGMSNREIAQALFVTMKAISMHLTHVYDKLGVSARTELGSALAGSMPAATS